MAFLSRQFNWGEGYAERPILTYLGLYFSLFAVYAGTCFWIIKNNIRDRGVFWIMIVSGLLFRAVLLPANQIQEDDIYRYLWDGKVFSNGMNPYKYAPAEVQQYLEFKVREPERFQEIYDQQNQQELKRLNDLKWENRRSLTVLDRVNHPDVPTIYPPMAQFVFRIVQHLEPDSILTMRLAFGLFDLLALGFIVLTLKALGKNPAWSLVYFWSPLIIKETFNSTHLDIIGIGFLCGSIYFLIQNRRALAAMFLGLSFLGKLYPVILLPLYLLRGVLVDREQGKAPWQSLLIQVAVFLAVVIGGYLPFLNTGWATFEGLKTFSTHWQSNDSVFALLVYFFGHILNLGAEGQTFLSQPLPTVMSKITVAVVLSAALIYHLIKMPKELLIPESFIHRLFIIMALVFLLSPVQNPWYLNWIVPFLCIFPRRAWLLLTGLLGLYYLDFYFDYQDIGQYTFLTPWLEYVPFYILLAWDWVRRPVPEQTPSL